MPTENGTAEQPAANGVEGEDEEGDEDEVEGAAAGGAASAAKKKKKKKKKGGAGGAAAGSGREGTKVSRTPVGLLPKPTPIRLL